MNCHPDRRVRNHHPAGSALPAVIVAMALAGAIVLWHIAQRLDEADDAARTERARQHIALLLTALNQYRLDNRTYPGNDQGLEALTIEPGGLPATANWREGGYLNQLPVDPWGRPYQYLNPGLHGTVDVYSLGADGAPGGRGIDADIGNWQD